MSRAEKPTGMLRLIVVMAVFVLVVATAVFLIGTFLVGLAGAALDLATGVPGP